MPVTGLRVLPGLRRTTEPAGEPPAGHPPPGPGRAPGGSPGLMGSARWGWRQLTSMRTALVLLFLLAVASVPGSVLPQQGIDPQAVDQYYAAHPALAPWLARLSLFNVFAAPWFAAIYLLLFLSLAGCVVPRTFRLAGSARQQPPRAPRNLSRLPLSVRQESTLGSPEALAAATSLLARKRYRIRTGDGWVAAEKGYLREAGNLLFHLALLGVLAAVGLGGLFGYKADRLLVAGQSFANTATELDQFRPGRLVSAADLQPFSIAMRGFSASYVQSGDLRGQPSSFNAYLDYSAEPGAPAHRYDLQVNHPLNVDGTKVYLIGHGYAPVFKLTQANGQVVFNSAVPFIPLETSGYMSEGVIKVPDAHPQQLGFAGVFLPTAVDVGGQLSSAFPAPLRPAVSLVSYAGNLGMNGGAPQSVYQLDTAGLHRLPVSPQPLAPGDSMKLPDGAGTLTFTGYRQWASLAITYDPGQVPALIAGVLALAGLLLSFLVRRRRMFVRAYPGEGGQTVVEVGGLARTEAAEGFEAEFAELSGVLTDAVHGTVVAAPPPGLFPVDDDAAAPAGAAAADSPETAADLPPSGSLNTGSPRTGPPSTEPTSSEPPSTESSSAEPLGTEPLSTERE
jgi:cytochrome c biogenesis protein